MSIQRWSGVTAGTGLVLLVMSVGLNTLQAMKIQDLVDRRTSPTSRVGQIAPPLAGQSLNGEVRTLQFTAGQPTVLYYFSPTCRWCEENWANVRALAAASTDRFRFVGVAAEKDLGRFARDRRLEFEILTEVPAEALRSLGFGATPHTLVISAQGRISQEWLGAFQGRRQRAVETFFDIELPGLVRSVDTR